MGTRIVARLLLVGAVAGSPAGAQPADPGAAAFAQSGCGVCHGDNGEGTTTGPRLAAHGLALADFTASVRRGLRTMPAYDAQALSDERVAAIHEYLESQPPGNVAAGRADAGARLFASYGCAYCHANEAQGGVAGPRLGPDPITFARFSWYVRHPTLQMPPYSTITVSDEDLASIYAFVASRPRPPPVSSISLLAP
jgi:mono/diheme cytochrome c family protein